MSVGSLLHMQVFCVCYICTCFVFSTLTSTIASSCWNVLDGALLFLSTFAHATCVHFCCCICCRQQSYFLCTLLIYKWNVQYLLFGSHPCWALYRVSCRWLFCVTFLVMHVCFIRIMFFCMHSFTFYSCTCTKKKRWNSFFWFLVCAAVSGTS